MKIALLTNSNHTKLAGIEVYNKNLINFLLKKNCVVDEYFTRKSECENNLNLIKHKNYNLKKELYNESFFKKILFFYKIKSKIIKIAKNYDLVIVSGGEELSHVNLNNVENLLYIQHFNIEMYKNKFLPYRTWIIKIILFLSTPLSLYAKFIWKANSVVFYDPITVPQKSKVKNKFYSIVPCDFNFLKTENLLPGNKIIYIGRLEKNQKQIKKVVYLAKKYNNIEIYGHGKYAKKIKKYSFFKGVASREQILEIFKTTKLLLLPSKYEGASLIISEAAACGVPTLCFNYWKMAYFWKKQNVAILAKNWKEYQKKLAEFQKLDDKKIMQIKKNIISKNKDVINLKNFEKKWESIIAFFDK